MSAIKDISLAKSGWDKINWVKSYMPILNSINKRFSEEKPFGTTMMDCIMENTRPENVFFEMDVYWAVVGGVSPVEYMKKYPERFEVIHIKDKNELGQSGMVGFDAIFNNFAKAGVQAFVVELEQASTPNILKGLRESALYLRKASFVKETYAK